jgi:hypothetical protein
MMPIINPVTIEIVLTVTSFKTSDVKGRERINKSSVIATLIVKKE